MSTPSIRAGLVDDLNVAAEQAESTANYLERDRTLIPSDALVSGLRWRAGVMREAARALEFRRGEGTS